MPPPALAGKLPAFATPLRIVSPEIVTFLPGPMWKTRLMLLPLTASRFAPRPTMLTLLSTRSSPVVSAIVWPSSEVCWVMALSVAERFRRRGVGRALLLRVERWCAEAGLRDIRVHSGEQRTDAHAFYEACGFEHTGRRFRKSLG